MHPSLEETHAMQDGNGSSDGRVAAAPAAHANLPRTAVAPPGAAAAALDEVTLAHVLQTVQAFGQQKEQAVKVQQDKEQSLKRLARETEGKHEKEIGELQGKLQQKDIELAQIRNNMMQAKTEATAHKKNVEELVRCMLFYADPQAVY